MFFTEVVIFKMNVIG